ncbi:hypothetical protein LH452_06975 [Laribacter hongkongensis]|uniref:hypothetical protein n=1 Tax=Laribacter hongkongensis TaxID=168471 RepID=UPI001EFDC5A7|nr:hypothetical protein [Laribacter hongkongensis]MCG9058691.1 hypothetical protein [Laribacter hongkongensis]MCG9084612.1 hypothetical protein [Laribacter hongkongensis]
MSGKQQPRAEAWDLSFQILVDHRLACRQLPDGIIGDGDNIISNRCRKLGSRGCITTAGGGVICGYFARTGIDGN